MRIQTIIKRLKDTYDFVGTPQHGIIKVISQGKYGFFDSTGKQIIPFMYEWVSSFCRFKLYGKQYMGAYVTLGDKKTIVGVNNRPIIFMMDLNARYHIINDKLWLQNEKGYNLVSRKGQKLLATDYEYISNDRFRQPKNIYLAEKDGRFGTIHISYNNKEKEILPFVFKNLSFWYAPIVGTLIKATLDGKNEGMYTLKGKQVIPCKYQDFSFQTPFRKGFILALGEKEHTLYAGTGFVPVAKSPYFINARYAFYQDETSYYSIHTTTQELLMNENNRIVASLKKKEHISLFHYLMSMHRKNFRFDSLDDLLAYCKKIKSGQIKLTPSVKRNLAVYGYFFLEEELHKYATIHGFEYGLFLLHDRLIEKNSWGTCRPRDREISLNLNLLFTSREFIRLVILHELVHLKNASHNLYFFRTLNKLFGSDTREKHNVAPVDILDTVDAVRIVKTKKKELFEAAKSQGIKLPMEQCIDSKVLNPENHFSNEDGLVAAMEK